MIRPLASQKGMALVVTLLITAFLVVVITEIVYAVHGYADMAALYSNGQRASVLAAGGVTLESSLLLNKSVDSGDKEPLGPDELEWTIKEDGGELRVVVSDEQGKISLNSIVDSKGALVEDKYDLFARLLDILELPPELSDILLDWIDKDRSLHGGRNAEGKLKNAPLDSVDELLLLDGFSPDTVKALKPFVTVYTDGLININSAPVEVIMALDKEVTSGMAEAVVSMRESVPFKAVSEIREIRGFSTLDVGLQKKITVSSVKYGILSRADFDGSIREVEAVIDITNFKAGGALYWRER